MEIYEAVSTAAVDRSPAREARRQCPRTATRSWILVVDIVGDAEPALERVPEQLQDSIALAWNSKWTRREYAEFR